MRLFASFGRAKLALATELTEFIKNRGWI